MRKERELLIDGNRGIYVPQRFTQLYNIELWHIEKCDADILMAGPDHAEYWETWDGVLNTAYFVDSFGLSWTLYQDGDLWVIPDGYDWDSLT